MVADPVAHSLSPHIHNAAFAAEGLNAVYVPFRVPVDDLEQFVTDLPRLGVKGLSVTIPHKEAVAKCLTKVDPAVKGIAAVNTVVLRNDQVIGYNTDYKAAMDCLEGALGRIGQTPARWPTNGCWCWAPAACRGRLCMACKSAGAKTVIASRTRSRNRTVGQRVRRPRGRVERPACVAD